MEKATRGAPVGSPATSDTSAGVELVTTERNRGTDLR